MALYLTLLAVLASSVTLVKVGLAASPYTLQCVCNNEQCKEQNKTICDKAVMCFTQYLKRRDGSDPITRGCINTRTSLLCENRRPAVANWPVLACCRSHMCNEPLPRHFADLLGNVTSQAAGANTGLTSETNRTEVEDASEDNSAEERETGVNDPPRKAETNFDQNKIHNNPRFLDTVKRKDLNIDQPPSDQGLTNFHGAIIVGAVAFLFLICLMGMILLRRQMRLFSAPYMAPHTYTKEANLTHHEHHCAPPRMHLPRGLPVHMGRTAYDNQVLHQQP